MQKLSGPLDVVKVAHHVTVDLQTSLMMEPCSTAGGYHSKAAWQGVLHCSSILHPPSELKANCSKLRPETKAHDNEKRKPHSFPPVI